MRPFARIIPQRKPEGLLQIPGWSEVLGVWSQRPVSECATNGSKKENTCQIKENRGSFPSLIPS